MAMLTRLVVVKGCKVLEAIGAMNKFGEYSRSTMVPTGSLMAACLLQCSMKSWEGA